MAYSELIKNFNRIRDYMREFYVYGFKSRDEYDKKSARSYDDERRRIESWLGENMQFRQTVEGKRVFISIDSRVSHHNPLYKAWKTKSFTDGDITLHFILFDILSSPDIALTIHEIMKEIDQILMQFETPRYFDESTVRKKLKEYVTEGIVTFEKKGKMVYYSRAQDCTLYSNDVLDFFSEIAPCGILGSYLLDKVANHKDYFAFKHHYITSTMDSEILKDIFDAMRQKRGVMLKITNRHRDRISDSYVIPVKVMISVQSGRQYLMAYVPLSQKIRAYRVDMIISVTMEKECEKFDEYRDVLDEMQLHMWGVSTQSASGQKLEHVEFTVQYAKGEDFIHNRLEREKRCGTVVKVDDFNSKFTADVFDTSEMIPWIRTFICRITDISFSNKELEKEFCEDIKRMYRKYGLEGGDKHDF